MFVFSQRKQEVCLDFTDLTLEQNRFLLNTDK